MVIPFSSRVVRFRADKGGEYTGKSFHAYCLETSIKQELAATNIPQQVGVSERLGRHPRKRLRFNEATFEDNNVSSEEMLRDVRGYSVALDFNIDIPADRDDPYSESLRRGVSPSGGATPEEPVPPFSPSPSLAPTSTSASTPNQAPAAPKATTGRTCRYAPPRGVTPAATRSQTTRQNKTHAATGNQQKNSNTCAAIVERFPSKTMLLNQLKKRLMDRFEMTDMGDVSRVFGMNVARDRKKGTNATKRRDYTEDVIERFDMKGCNRTYTPGVGPELSLSRKKYCWTRRTRALPIHHGCYHLPCAGFPLRHPLCP